MSVLELRRKATLQHREETSDGRAIDSSNSTSDPSMTSGNTNSLQLQTSKMVRRSKLCVYTSLITSSIVLGVAAFLVTRSAEHNRFAREFRELAHELIDIAQQNAHHTVGQVETLATVMASYAATTSPPLAWPLVTMPHFELVHQEAMHITGAELMAVAPVVTLEETTAFEEYANRVDGGKAVHSTIHPTKTASTSNDTFYAPLWQMAFSRENSTAAATSALASQFRLLNMESFDWFANLEQDVREVHHSVMGPILAGDEDFLDTAQDVERHPRTVILMEVPRSLHNKNFTAELPVAFAMAFAPWEDYFTNIVPEGVPGFVVEVNDHCGTVFAYMVHGHDATLRGEGNLHDSSYDYLHEESDFAGFAQYDGGDAVRTHCHYTIDVYPTQQLEDYFKRPTPYIFSVGVTVICLFTIGIFFCYDFLVTRLSHKTARLAKRTTKIVSSLFPKSVQKRILEEAIATADGETDDDDMDNSKHSQASVRYSMKERFKSALSLSTEATPDNRFKDSPPIAELFPAVTVMFADLVGFTAWSSMREPAQVFRLLETIYAEFDAIAKRKQIFKVETVGDCYVAACGLPDPRRDHAVAMVRFASDCRQRIQSLLQEMEIELGPDTTELGVRIGLHSGPVTGGVLRGAKARFQLFGETVNITAIMEGAGAKNKIHVSEETAQMVKQLGKGYWLEERTDNVVAMGSTGPTKTFWVTCSEGPVSSTLSNSVQSVELVEAAPPLRSTISPPTTSSSLLKKTLLPSADQERIRRLIRWNADVMGKILQDIAHRREALDLVPQYERVRKLEQQTLNLRDHLVLDEVVEIIALPTYNHEAAVRQAHTAKPELSPKITALIERYSAGISSLYRSSNPFHNFEHVSHVLMSVTKLLSRIVAPELGSLDEKTVHDHTYGITSDPLTHFAAAFAALIHDVDHQGVTNATLIKEGSPLAAFYKNKSVAEQNSVDIAWNLFLDPAYVELRNSIYATPAEFLRFRQLVVNLVMATDIMDKEIGKVRKERWNKAFVSQTNDAGPVVSQGIASVNRKATIVLEHVIQASDVAHTMQHWHIYRKWNHRLFCESMKAYQEGRTDKNPADQWFEGEIGFFDYYIIPLAKKLSDCGVFGVSSDEYLNYALKNRREWERKGKGIVAEMLETLSST